MNLIAKNASAICSETNQDNETAYHSNAPTSKPVGEAVREDGTLKDASEITWLHSPSQEHRLETNGEKRKRHGSDSDDKQLPEYRVSKTFDMSGRPLTDCKSKKVSAKSSIPMTVSLLRCRPTIVSVEPGFDAGVNKLVL